MNKLLLTICIITFFSSCEKKVIEIVPVIEVEKDMSVSGAKDIRFFAFPSNQVGFAASDTSFIYKTNDGGDNWSIIKIGQSNEKCKGLEFFNEQNGMCLMGNILYITDDGGDTWNESGVAEFIGKTKGGIGIWGEASVIFKYEGNQGFRFISYNIKITQDNAKSFQSIGRIDKQDLGITAVKAWTVGSKVVLSIKDAFSIEEDEMRGIDIFTGENIWIRFSVPSRNPPNGIYLTGQEDAGVLVGPKGLLMDNFLLGYNDIDYGHEYTYNSVDGYGDLIVCVGEKTITSNMEIGNGYRWNEVYDVNGNGFFNTFYKVQFMNQNTLYISGNDGLIIKAKI